MHTDFRRIAEKSIDELEGRMLTPPFASGLIESIARARATPLRALTPASLRLLVSQRVSLVNTVPRAIEILNETPLVEAQLYAGDLLFAVLDLDEHGIAAASPAILVDLIERALAQLAEVPETLTAEDYVHRTLEVDDIDREFLTPKLRAALVQLQRGRNAV